MAEKQLGDLSDSAGWAARPLMTSNIGHSDTAKSVLCRPSFFP